MVDEKAARLSDDDARRILLRASELDAVRSGTMTPEELRDIAGEAGISTESFIQAMRDVSRGQLTEVHAAPAKKAQFYKRFFGRRTETTEAVVMPSLFRSFVAAAAGVLLSFTGAFRSEEFIFAGFLAALVGSLHLISFHRHRGTNESYQLELISLWGAFVASLAMIVRDDAVVLVGIGWIFVAVIGGIIIRLSRPPKILRDDD